MYVSDVLSITLKIKSLEFRETTYLLVNFFKKNMHLSYNLFVLEGMLRHFTISFLAIQGTQGGLKSSII